MPRILYRDLDLALEPGETVLDALLRGGAPVQSMCRAGACQTCMLRASAGDPGAPAQQGLRPAQRERGWFLACVCRPAADLTIADEVQPSVPAEIVALEDLGAAVLRVRLRPLGELAYRPGQYVQVVRGDGLARSYSLASVPEEDALLELHVRVHARGQMSRWLAAQAPGARVELRGPAGECFYTEGAPAQPLALIGTGTGLSPLLGVVRDALRRGHTGPITLVHGARDGAGFYLVDALEALARAAGALRYVRCAMSGEPAPGLEIGDIAVVGPRSIGSLKGARVFLAGGPEQVAALKKRCFLAGANLRDISADPFVVAAPTG